MFEDILDSIKDLEPKKMICLYPGPGSGKSTTMGGLFYFLKLAGYDAEQNSEYVKNWVWEDRCIKDGDQTYFFAKQSRRERMLMQKGLDFVVTDSPLLLTHFYGLKYDKFEQLTNTSLMMLKNHHEYCKQMGYKTEHFVIQRNKKYVEKGRFQTETEARRYDVEIANMLDDMGIKYRRIEGDMTTHVAQILKSLPKKNVV